MAAILWNEILDGVRGYNGICKLALITGLVYHFTCQFPKQNDVIICLCTFATCNIMIIASVCLREWEIQFLEIGLLIFIFNTIFVACIRETVLI